MISKLTNIARLLEDGGEITLGRLNTIGECIATATDDTQCIAMLVRRKDESLDALLERLDAVIANAHEHERFTDEINAAVRPRTTTKR